MLKFLARRLGALILTAFAMTVVVFALTNIEASLRKLAVSEVSSRATPEEVQRWMERSGFTRPITVRYAEWLGVAPAYVTESDGRLYGRCVRQGMTLADVPRYCGVLQGDFGYSTVLRDEVSAVIGRSLALTAKLMLWVMLLMVPAALIVGVLSGMREGSKLDRTLSTFSIATTATPEYVSGVVLIAVFASSAVGLRWFSGTATGAMEDATFQNFFLPVLTIALYGVGYIARMTRASMTEVMTAQYIRTARLKGVSFPNIVMKHALRNALIAPFTVIMLQFPWLLNGVVIVETLFNYKGFGWTLVQAASNNDIDLLLACSVVAVVVVLVTQLISDVGYVFLNPRIRVS